MRLLAVASVAVFAATAVAQTKRGDCSITQQQDGTASVRGTVVRNDHSCSVDGGCFLVLGCPGSEFAIDYVHGGDLPENSDAYRKAQSSGAAAAVTKLAWDIRAGEEVEAHGPVTTQRENHRHPDLL